MDYGHDRHAGLGFFSAAAYRIGPESDFRGGT